MFCRTHFAHQKSSNHLELSFHNGDIFHITDTLFGGTVGFWQATRVYSAADSANYGQNDNCKGVIPNLETAEMLAKAARADTSTCGRSTFFRRKLKERRTKSLTKNVIDDVTFENTCDMAFPAYERVTLKHPQFQRPLVLFGPLADIARQRLLTNFALRFSGIADESIMRLSAIDAVINANKHCVLDVSPGSVERLQLAQYAPIVIFIDVESRSRIRDLRSKAATLDATKEDGWFEALLQLIAHLQDRRVWMPEFRPLTNLNDVILLPMHCFHNPSDSDVDSIKGEYSTSEYLTRSQVQLEKGDPHVKLGYDEFDPKYQRSLRLTPSHLNPNNYPPPPSPAAPGMLASRGTFYQNVYPCEPLSQYSSRVQLTSPCINPTAQQLPSSVQRNYYFDTPTSSTSSIPTWATLPRRQNNHIVDTFPTTTITEPGILTRTITNTPIIKTTATITTSTTTTTTTTTTTITNRLLNYSQSILTRCNPSQFVIQQQQQHSPVAQRQQHFRQRNILQSSSLRQSPQKSSDKASPPQVSADTYHPGGSSKTAHEDDIISSTMAISNNCNTMTTNIITDMNKNRRINLAIPEAADTVTDNNMPSAFHDMKQIELEKSTVNARKNQQSHYQNADNSSSYAVNNHLNSVKNHMNHTGQPGLFYDHLTRDRWMCNQSDRRLNTPHQATYENSSPRVPTSEELSFCAKNFNMNRNEVEMIYGTSTDNCSTQSTHASVATTEVDSLSECINTENMKLDEVNNGRKNYSDTTIIEHITDIIGARGGTLNCPKTGVSLIIPEGAINEGSMQEIYIKVCRANEAESQPPLDESRGESLMSPLVMCGPQDLQFNVPVELRLPHSVSNNADNWSLALKSCDGQHWDQMALDRNTSSAVTDNYVSIKINHF
ncbi:unnamed protein product [Thelazia callipaeda]|uniref:ZU5 domain-containing protein n=1 Tax=Thelazia callipaeda TaxID=103827 RepID=A0A0N5CRE1_THECL|nr:unnamed protein product [Thelazia callipaeda]